MQVLFTFLLSLGLLVGLLLVLRRPVRWYLGIDTHLQNQRDIITLLSALSGGGLQTTAGPITGRSRKSPAETAVADVRLSSVSLQMTLHMHSCVSYTLVRPLDAKREDFFCYP